MGTDWDEKPGLYKRLKLSSPSSLQNRVPAEQNQNEQDKDMGMKWKIILIKIGEGSKARRISESNSFSYIFHTIYNI